MAWLLREGEVLASVELVESVLARQKGLLGRRDVDGAVLLRPQRSVHTIGMRFPIDVAYCDRNLVVLATSTLRPFRFGLPHKHGRSVLEARAGAFERWGLRPGDRLEVKG
jgi:uncharacterized membrane protein (UPF0127 family)